jgi:hypothetical protein
MLSLLDLIHDRVSVFLDFPRSFLNTYPIKANQVNHVISPQRPLLAHPPHVNFPTSRQISLNAGNEKCPAFLIYSLD